MASRIESGLQLLVVDAPPSCPHGIVDALRGCLLPGKSDGVQLVRFDPNNNAVASAEALGATPLIEIGEERRVKRARRWNQDRFGRVRKCHVK